MIWLIGGTSECREIGKMLDKLGQPFVLSVATSLGAETYKDVTPNLAVGRLTEAEFAQAFQKWGITHVIDASHPHAAVVSQMAMKLCQKLNIRYTRFERPLVLTQDESLKPHDNELFESFQAVWKDLQKEAGKVLVTGSKELREAVSYLDAERIVARVVPSVESMQLCEAAGITSDRIVGLKGPFNLDSNLFIMKQFDISHMVFKLSGEESGFEDKMKAVRALNVRPWIVKPLEVECDEKINGLKAMTAFLSEIYDKEVSE